MFESPSYKDTVHVASPLSCTRRGNETPWFHSIALLEFLTKLAAQAIHHRYHNEYDNQDGADFLILHDT